MDYIFNYKIKSKLSNNQLSLTKARLFAIGLPLPLPNSRSATGRYPIVMCYFKTFNKKTGFLR